MSRSTSDEKGWEEDSGASNLSRWIFRSRESRRFEQLESRSMVPVGEVGALEKQDDHSNSFACQIDHSSYSMETRQWEPKMEEVLFREKTVV